MLKMPLLPTAPMHKQHLLTKFLRKFLRVRLLFFPVLITLFIFPLNSLSLETVFS